jgi:hypothetical protein
MAQKLLKFIRYVDYFVFLMVAIVTTKTIHEVV